MPSETPPLEPMESQGTSAPTIVDLAGYRIQSGKSSVPRHTRCAHKSVLYDWSERRIWCRDCNGAVDAFDGFMTLVEHFGEMSREARLDRAKAADAREAVIVRRAAKEIDRTWGHKMAPCCPHCRNGLLPQDFADGASMAVSLELEVARRRRVSGNGQ